MLVLADKAELVSARIVLGDFAVDTAPLRHGKLEHLDDIQEITKAIADFTQLRIKQRLEETLEIPPLPETARHWRGRRSSRRER